MIRWTKEFSVNVPEMDQQHQFFITALNDFYEGIRTGVPKENIHKLIETLIHYTHFHFNSEEALMASVNYPFLESHRKEHQEFVQKVTEFQDKFTRGKLMGSLEVTGFMKDWILNHILDEDKKYAAFINQ